MPHRSFWLEEVAGDAPDAAALEGDARADVAILGGGYVGLWTALQIKRLEPSRDVAVLEQDICGGGASGRNGGFVLSWWSKLSSLVALCGPADALRVARGSEAAIGEIRDFCETHSIDAHFRQGGWLWTATSTAQLGAWDGVLSAAEKLGVEPFRRLTPDEVARRSGSRRSPGRRVRSERRHRAAGGARARTAAGGSRSGSADLREDARAVLLPRSAGRDPHRRRPARRP